MKKIIIIQILFITILLSACNGSTVNSDEKDSVKDKSEISTTITTDGIASHTWHDDTNTFTAIVSVTLTEDKITAIHLSEASTIHSGTEVFRTWEQGREAYEAQYIDKSVEDIVNLKVNPSKLTDHFDGGSIEGCLDAVSGATASSVTYALAVKNAVSKIVIEQDIE